MTNMEEMRQLSKEQIPIGFVTPCIEDVANRLGMDYLEVYKHMNAIALFPCLHRIPFSYFLCIIVRLCAL